MKNQIGMKVSELHKILKDLLNKIPPKIVHKNFNSENGSIILDKELLDTIKGYGHLKFGDKNYYEREIVLGALKKFVDEARKWISVEDRLPETLKSVLGCNKNGYMWIVKYTKGGELEYYDEDGEEEDSYLEEGWYESSEQFNSDYSEFFFEREIIYWMPLPEPPLN